MCWLLYSKKLAIFFPKKEATSFYNAVNKKYTVKPLKRTPKGQKQISALQTWVYYRGRECMIFGFSETKQTAHNREVSIL